MAFVHPKLAYAVGWKFNHQLGMGTCNGELTSWPSQPWPTDLELAGYVDEYLAYLASNQCKDDELQDSLDRGDWKAVKTLATVLIQKNVCTLAELRAIYRGL